VAAGFQGFPFSRLARKNLSSREFRKCPLALAHKPEELEDPGSLKFMDPKIRIIHHPPPRKLEPSASLTRVYNRPIRVRNTLMNYPAKKKRRE